MTLSNATLLTTGIIIMILSCCLMSLFIYIIFSAKKDNRGSFYRLRDMRVKIQQLEHESDRTFGEFSYLVDRRIRNVFMNLKKKNLENFSQTDVDLELGMRRSDAGSQTEIAVGTVQSSSDHSSTAHCWPVGLYGQSDIGTPKNNGNGMILDNGLSNTTPTDFITIFMWF